MKMSFAILLFSLLTLNISQTLATSITSLEEQSGASENFGNETGGIIFDFLRTSDQKDII